MNDERDACGVGFIADVRGPARHEILAWALEALTRLQHRGAVSADAETGDGAGVLFQIPQGFFRREATRLGARLCHHERLAVGMAFVPEEEKARAEARGVVEEVVRSWVQEAGERAGVVARRLRVRWIGWRRVPIAREVLGRMAAGRCPAIEQFLISSGGEPCSAERFERELYLIRKRIEQRAEQAAVPLYIVSLSHRTIVYKGLMVSSQLGRFYLDLQDPSFKTRFVIFHQRYSTNTLPNWELAQPFRMLAHNGEINTVQGNRNWMRAREVDLSDSVWGEDAAAIPPIIWERGSDSASLDNVLELLVLSGRPLLHAMMLLVPEAHEKIPNMDEEVRGFYEYHECLMEPWDGPAALCFSDGRIVGAALDRNGLRPARYLVTEDGIVLVASEVGVLSCAPERIVEKGRLGPGMMLAVDTEQGRLWNNDEIKRMYARRRPYARWVKTYMIREPGEDFEVRGSRRDTPADLTIGGEPRRGADKVLVASRGVRTEVLQNPQASCGEEVPGEIAWDVLVREQRAFGYTQEDVDRLLLPMVCESKEPTGSMGDDTPLSVFSQKPRLLYTYFKQRFAQVTNPPIDPLREEVVMSLSMLIGARRSWLEESPEACRVIKLSSPILTEERFRWLLEQGMPWVRLEALFLVSEGVRGLRRAVHVLRESAERAVRQGAQILVVSDRGVDADRAPVPMLLAVGAVHHHLLRCGLRLRVSLVVETGEAWEDHHFACLLGYGANAIFPYLALGTVRALVLERVRRSPQGDTPGVPPLEAPAADREISWGPRKVPARSQDRVGRSFEGVGEDPEQAVRNYIRALEKGLLKIMSKMGISVLLSYHGAQVFEALGLAPDLIEECFRGTPSRIGGVSYEGIAREVLRRHESAFGRSSEAPRPITKVALSDSFVRALEDHGFYRYRRGGEYHAFNPEVIRALHRAVREDDPQAFREYVRAVEGRPPVAVRDLLEFRRAGDPVSVEDVEPVETILSRFSASAMSHGALSREAHEAIAIAMNRLGARSNSGEGGEDPTRYRPRPTGEWPNSLIKQVASARFGVTPEYLCSAAELEIKMAQGSKPGEGGQLPGHKVTPEIARIRHTLPGVTLISPPPHHDIYSIEDLAQLIYDLRQINPTARIAVKLVAEAGIGTIAAGIAKAGADVIHVSGHDGGTGASPLGSIKHAGVPWELGVSEVHRVLCENGLRERVRLRVDGGLKTGRDVVIAALLGADEFGFGTATLVALGCVMARQCHLNTCPVGIATQREDLRARFPGRPEHVERFFRFLAVQVREILAQLGVRRLDEIIGRTDLLVPRRVGHELGNILESPADQQIDWGVPPWGVLQNSRDLVEISSSGDFVGIPSNGKGRGETPQIVFARDAQIFLDEVLRASSGFPRARLKCPQGPSRPTLGERILPDLVPALEGERSVRLTLSIQNTDRAVGVRIAGEIARRYGDAGLAETQIELVFRGSAGQSFGAFCLPGMRLVLIGEANDYVGKGMRGGELILRPPENARYVWHRNVIVGNTVLYGATGGRLFAAGRAGERFAVRNSGAVAVVEGVGDHGCEYMTGGIVLVLGEVGRNFAAGMTGGLAFVYDEEGRLPHRINGETVRLERLSPSDEEMVRTLVSEHLRATGSARAQEILERWSDGLSLFWKIVPRSLCSENAQFSPENEFTPAP